jgi:hypothetical protein
MLNTVQWWSSMTLQTETVAEACKQSLIRTAVRNVAGCASSSLGGERAGGIMLEPVGSRLLRMALVAVCVSAVSEICGIAASEIVTTHARQGPIGQGMVGPLAEVVNDRHVTYTAEGTLLVDQ